MKKSLLSAICLLCLVGCEDKPPASDPATTVAAPPPAENTAHQHHVMDHEGHGDHAAHEHKVLPAGEVVPGSSLYQLDVELVGQDGRPRTWKDFAGSEVVVSMVYTSCTTACPMIVSEIKQILKASGRESLPVLLVSMDPERDDPEALAQMKAKHAVGDNWTLVRASEDDVREISAALGIRYRKLPSGDFNHSQVITLLDEEGSIVERAEGLGPQRNALVEELRAAE